MTEVDVLVIGGGTAGEYAAGTALGFDKRVAIAEHAKIGGDCIFHACIPTKTLAHAARLYEKMSSADFFGLPAMKAEADYADIKAFKDRIITPLGEGRAERWRKRGAVVVQGSARFSSSNTVEVGSETVRADQIIICTGSVPAVPPIDGFAEAGYITNVEALELTQVPRSLAIIGGGPIGIEFGQMFATFGCEVTIYEAMPHVLPLEDKEISAACEGFLKSKGITIHTDIKVVRVERTAEGKAVTTEDSEGRQNTTIHSEIMAATGRRPTIEGLNLDAAVVAYDRKGIKVDGTLRSTVPHIWAAGDVAGGPMFTYVAGEQGKTAALNCCDGGSREIDYSVFPRATYSQPEVASVGLTEEQAHEHGWNVSIGRFNYADLTRGILTGETDGFIKVVAEKGTGRLLGGHIIGAEASNLIHELAVALTAGIPASQVGSLLHVYPAWSEAVRYACQAVD